jgi:hypothetical protein
MIVCGSKARARPLSRFNVGSQFWEIDFDSPTGGVLAAIRGRLPYRPRR